MSGFSIAQYAGLYQGLPAVGGQLTVYQTGTTTLVTIYSDAALTVPLTNGAYPNGLVLDSNGKASFYYSGAVNLKLVSWTASGTLIETLDPVYPTGAAVAGTTIKVSSNISITAANAGNNLVSTTPVNFTLPFTSSLTNSFNFNANAQGGAITLIPQSSDAIQSGAAGANFVITSSKSGEVWTDANGNWGINFLTTIAQPAPILITGCLLTSLAGTASSATATITSGIATDSTNVSYITTASSGYSWAASNGAVINGTDAASSTLANSTTYHMYLCNGSSGTGTYASASYPVSAVTFPSGYRTYARRIGSFVTASSGAPLPYTPIETEGGASLSWLTTQLLDINTSTLGSTQTLFALSVPTGIKVHPIIRALAPGLNAILLTSGDETNVAVSSVASQAPQWDLAGPSSQVTVGGAQPVLSTNVSGQIGARSTSSNVSLYCTTRGWIDWRRS